VERKEGGGKGRREERREIIKKEMGKEDTRDGG